MNQFFFWNFWHSKYKNLYRYLLLVFLLSIISYGTAYFFGQGHSLGWDIVTRLEPFSLVADTVYVGGIELQVPVDNFLVHESFSGSNIKVNEWIAYSLLFFSAIGIIFLLSVITTLSRFWYIAGMAAFVLLILGFRFEQLMLFGTTDNTALILVLILFLPLSYYFHAINPSTGFITRLLAFSGIFIILSLAIFLFSATGHPFAYLAAYGVIVPVILSIFFIFLVAHDIIAGFLYLVTSGNTEYSKNSLGHFVTISIIYLLAVLLNYLKNTKVIEWDIIYLDAFLLLVVSGILGIWGLRKRSALFENVLPFRPLGAFAFLSLGIICFSTLAYLFATANDPLIEAMEDAIIYSHLCLGLMFFIYILANFYTLLKNNMKVHKVLYKPRNMPFYMARIAGVIAVAILFIQAGMFPYNQAIAGYYNNLGDLYTFDRQNYLAERYYKLGREYEYQNHHSNYALASLAYAQNEDAEAISFFKGAVLKKPSEQAYVNLGKIYQENGRFFDALFSLREGMEAFPGSGPIENNLALLYRQANVIDSALLFLDEARDKKVSKKEAGTNILAIWAASSYLMPEDSLKELYNSSTYPPFKSNLLVLASQEREVLKGEIDSDSLLNIGSFSHAYNYMLNHLYDNDSSHHSTISSLKSYSGNADYADFLDYSLALSYYYHGNIRKAFITIDQLRSNSIKPGYYSYLLGLWSLQQEAPELAVEFFSDALLAGYHKAIYGKAIALAETGKLENASKEWQFLIEQDSSENNIARLMYQVTNLSTPLDVKGKSDFLNYQIMRYHIRRLTPAGQMSILDSIDSKKYKAMALLLLAQRYKQRADWDALSRTLQDLKKIGVKEERQQEQIHQLELEMLWGTNEYKSLAEAIESLNNRFNNKFYYLYYKALLYQHDGEMEKANELFKVLSTNNPFYEKGVIGAANFFDQVQQDEFLAYETLLNALNINTKSTELYKAYILQSLKMQLTSYAESALDELKEITSSQDYSNFKITYDSTFQAVEKNF